MMQETSTILPTQLAAGNGPELSAAWSSLNSTRSMRLIQAHGSNQTASEQG